MATIRIPPDHREVVAVLSHLPQEQLDAINAALLDARADIAASRAALGPFLKTPSVALDALVGMTNTSLSHGLSRHDMMSAIREALGEEAGESDFSGLLDNKTVKRLAKRLDVGYSHERLVGNVRIFTEMRPIFDDPVSDSFQAAVITHSLRITAYESGEPHELYFTVDGQDLKLMGEQVARAQEKEKSLKAMLEKAGVTSISQPEGDAL